MISRSEFGGKAFGAVRRGRAAQSSSEEEVEVGMPVKS